MQLGHCLWLLPAILVTSYSGIGNMRRLPKYGRNQLKSWHIHGTS
jgi:hypothetical protein